MSNRTIKPQCLCLLWFLLVSCEAPVADTGADADTDAAIDVRVSALLEKMTLAEKIGQMSQINGAAGKIPADLHETVKQGRIGSILNEVEIDVVNGLQRIAVEESRLGIPLMFGRDVVHGFQTILPIPLGLAATFNPELVRRGARMAALEASASGINWTFAPMIDVSRDPRWGRIAESFGEDPYLTGVLAAASVEGFQGEDLAHPDTIAACAKHFAGYGASEAGRDYNTTPPWMQG
jgi:beta-glucosidase